MCRNPKITVVVPVYNVGTYLPACLRSIAGQTFTDFEALLMNDGSTDHSSDVIALFAARDARFVRVDQPNGGLAVVRRAGTERAKGDFVCFVDGDDFLSADYLERLYGAARRYGADMAVARTVRWFGKDRPAERENSSVFGFALLEKEKRGVMLENFSEAMSVCGKLVRTDLMRRVIFPEQKMQEDIFPAVQLTALAEKIAPVPDAYYFYRQNRPGSVSRITEGRFALLWKSFADAAVFLRRRGCYDVFARRFEYVRWGCLLSHASAFGLSGEEYGLLKENRKEILALPQTVFKGRPNRFRMRFWVLQRALACGFSYPAALKCIQLAAAPFKNTVQRFRRKKEEK